MSRNPQEITKAMAVPDYASVFQLGCIAKRLTFLVQQHGGIDYGAGSRALNLALKYGEHIVGTVGGAETELSRLALLTIAII